MDIERFGLSHLDGVCKIENTCFTHPWSRYDLASQIDKATSHFFVAVDNGIVVGYMGLQVFASEGYVTNVAVLPEHRNRGIAKALVAKCLEVDMDFISLEVRVSNTPAINLYSQLGFQNMGVRPRFYTDPVEDAIIMTKVLKS